MFSRRNDTKMVRLRIRPYISPYCDLPPHNKFIPPINEDHFFGDMSLIKPMRHAHGGKSFILGTEQARRLEAKRPNTKLIVFEECGHGVHSDDLNGYYQAVNDFLMEQK